MDNVTYDELAPVSNDVTSSRLRTTQTEIEPSYELQIKADSDQNAIKEIQQNNSNHSSHNTKFNTVMIIMVVILLLITLTSIALSVTTLNCLAS